MFVEINAAVVVVLTAVMFWLTLVRVIFEVFKSFSFDDDYVDLVSYSVGPLMPACIALLVCQILRRLLR